MSYCRWSSDDFACDLYVYEASDGYTIHVASNRVVGEAPKIAWPTGDKSEDHAEAVARLLATHRAQHAYLETAEHVPLGLPHDGETFVLATASECADVVERLLRLGYRAPDYVVEALREEAATNA